MSNISSQSIGSPDALNRAVAPGTPPAGGAVAGQPAGQGAGAHAPVEPPMDDGNEARLKALREGSAAQEISASQAARAAYTVGAGMGGASSLPQLAEHADGKSPTVVSQARASLDRLSSGGNFNELLAFQILQQAASKNLDSQSRAHSAALQSSLGKQMAIAEDTMAKAKADQKSATFSFMTNLAGSATAFSMGFHGVGAAEKKRPIGKGTAESSSSQSHLSSPIEKFSNEEKPGSAINLRDLVSKRVHEDVEGSASKTENVAGQSERESHLHAKKESELRAEGEQRKTEESHLSNDAQKQKDIQAEQEGRKSLAVEKTLPHEAAGSKNAAKKAGIYAASQSAAQLVTTAGEAVNQNLLFGAQSHNAEIDQKVDELGKTIADQQLESSKTGREKASKMLEDAISALKQHFDLVKSANDRIGS